MNRKFTIAFFFSFMICLWSNVFAQSDTTFIEFNDATAPQLIRKNVYLYKDINGSASFQDIINKKFDKYQDGQIINLGVTDAKVWLRLPILNNTNERDFYLMLQQSSIHEVIMYTVLGEDKVAIDSLGKYKPFYERFVYSPDYIFPVKIKQGERKEIFLSISSNDQLQLPIYFGTEKVILQKTSSKNLIFGLYAGAVLIMMLYNFFISTSTRDISYAFYILYIFSVGLTQAMFQGYAFMYLWPNSPWLASYSSLIVPFFSGVMTIGFIKTFLHTKLNTPTLDKGINMIVVLYMIGLVFGLYKIHYGVILLQMMASLGSLYVLFVVEKIRRKGYRPAIFFLIAFSLFFFTVIIFVLRNFNVIQYNSITAYILEIGSILEISLLSFALADRINFYRKEKEASQLQALKISQENARIIREQNLLLETEVDKRTADLQRSNESLNEAMHNLKQAQAHLVESEKLASLGMLTAGIAHEINNPINFVTANVKPLKRDIEQIMEVVDAFEKIGLLKIEEHEKIGQFKQYKEEIDFEYLKEEIQLLLKGIQEGAHRTAEIVKSLRIFSRVDEDDLKLADLNLGIESTLVILNSMFKERIVIDKNFGTIPYIECFPGKLNQVFLNLITNAIHAIDEKFKGRDGGRIGISTYKSGDLVFVSIKDNGTGIREEVQSKIFDPFFTTKEVGEGTGLGLAIVAQTIAKHKGEIELLSEAGSGCEFIIKIPVIQRTMARLDEDIDL